MVRLSTRSRSAELGVRRGAPTTGAPFGDAARMYALRCSAWALQSDHLRIRPAPEGVIAPKAYDHAMNAETFEAWLEHHLLPTLEEGDIVVLDNLKAHKSPRVAEILARKTARTIPAAIQPGLQPHRDGDFQTEKRAAKIGLAHRCRPSCYPGGLRRSFKPAECKLFEACGDPANSKPSTQPARIALRSRRRSNRRAGMTSTI